ncbi:MAG: enoyl-CoA hydratase/isomerase family protein [Alicyclobacillus sp.]|nr:enoyl-CoA hydratase/isomerase family protein [Alicyclobacillus sp.]
MAAQSERKYVTWTKDDAGVATMVINNPPMNVLSEPVNREIKQCVEEMAADHDVVAIVVTGAGERAFVAGADIKEFPSLMKPGGGRAGAKVIHEALNALDFIPKPTIAAIHGYAFGGGFELALACDLRIAAHGAQLGQPEIRLGILPGFGGTQRLPRLVGRGRALQLLLSGERVTADAAQAMGLVNEVVAPDALYATGLARARQLAELPPLALAWVKRAVYEGTELDLSRGLSLEAALFGLCFATHDQKEGMAAFLAKRPPVFEGK